MNPTEIGQGWIALVACAAIFLVATDAAVASPGPGSGNWWLARHPGPGARLEPTQAPGIPARPAPAGQAGPVRDPGFGPLIPAVPPVSLLAPVSEPVRAQQGRPPAGAALSHLPGRGRKGPAERGQIRRPRGTDAGGRAADLLRQGRRGADGWTLHSSAPARPGAPDLGRGGLRARRQLEPRRRPEARERRGRHSRRGARTRPRSARSPRTSSPPPTASTSCAPAASTGRGFASQR